MFYYHGLQVTTYKVTTYKATTYKTMEVVQTIFSSSDCSLQGRLMAVVSFELFVLPSRLFQFSFVNSSLRLIA